ncbi:MAG: PepSY domain-containing protein, partial [Roseovarius sp.]|nr:PepSY domain-containing protein [Roseovarius sp.]
MKPIFFAALVALLPAMAGASPLTDAKVAALQADGYDRIEVKTGRSQTKIEALRGAEKLEVVYDSATGQVLKREIESAAYDDDISVGVKYRSRDRDFV